MNTTIDTSLGPLRATFTPEGALRRLRFGTAGEKACGSTAPAEALAVQLRAYARGERPAFDVPLVLEGTAFEQRVWRVLQQIPYGTTTTYGALAQRLGAPGAAQAVGGGVRRKSGAARGAVPPRDGRERRPDGLRRGHRTKGGAVAS